MRRGGYRGGSTLLGRKSNWFARDRQPTEAERLEKRRLKEENKAKAEALKVRAEQRAAEKAKRRAEQKLQNLQKAEEQARKHQARLELREKQKNDPKRLAKVAENLRKQEEKMSSVTVEVKKSKIAKNRRH